MWAEACQILDRAERMQRRFFAPGDAVAEFSWEPPVDIFETADEFVIEIALPGVEPRATTVSLADGALIVAAERPLPVAAGRAAIRRLELPHGRFERRIAMPAGRYELARREFANGCLLLVLRKVGQR
jgi:HSP20 family protein